MDIGLLMFCIVVGAALPVATYFTTRMLWPSWPDPVHLLWRFVCALGAIGFTLLMYWSLSYWPTHDFNNYVLFGPAWLGGVVILWIITMLAKARTQE